MPLKLDFKAGEKLVINGAVVENVGSNAKLLVHNESAILREKEVLSEVETVTPAARVYFALQCAYMFPRFGDKYVEMFRTYLDDFVGAAPSAQKIADEISANVDQGRMYKALKTAQKLIRHEADVFGDLAKKLEAKELTAQMDNTQDLS